MGQKLNGKRAPKRNINQWNHDCKINTFKRNGKLNSFSSNILSISTTQCLIALWIGMCPHSEYILIIGLSKGKKNTRWPNEISSKHSNCIAIAFSNYVFGWKTVNILHSFTQWCTWKLANDNEISPIREVIIHALSFCKPVANNLANYHFIWTDSLFDVEHTHRSQVEMTKSESFRSLSRSTFSTPFSFFEHQIKWLQSKCIPSSLQCTINVNVKSWNANSHCFSRKRPVGRGQMRSK